MIDISRRASLDFMKPPTNKLYKNKIKLLRQKKIYIFRSNLNL